MSTKLSDRNWEEQKAKLKEKFAALTESDFIFICGKEEEMIGKLEIKLGKTKKELCEILRKL